MELEELAKGMRDRECTPENRRSGGYSTLLLRCGCANGQHALTAAACTKDSAEAVKLFGAALSWYKATGRRGALTFVLGTDKAEHWKDSLHAIQMLQPRGLEIDLQVDFGVATALSDADLSSPSWVDDILLTRRPSLPSFGCRLASSAGIDSFAWYHSVTGRVWSGRLDGLEVCTLSDDGSRLTFNVGKTSSRGVNSSVRKAFLKIIDAHSTLFGAPNKQGHIRLDQLDEGRAVTILKILAESGIALQGSQEHLLESRVLRGAIKLSTKEGPLEVVMKQHPFQFPARWWPRGGARYVDVIARQAAAPWVVELKVDQSQGEHYRDGLVQAALYREYILRSPGLDRWFEEWQLHRRECRAVLVIPRLRGPDAALLREDHSAVADLLGVDLIELVDEASRSYAHSALAPQV